MTSIDFLVLAKNNFSELFETLNSIPSPACDIALNVNIIDGSNAQAPGYILANIFRFTDISWQYYWTPQIKGIYPSMNFALSTVKSDWFIFLNSGDSIHPSFSFESVCHVFVGNSSIIFGQAEIVSASSSVSWLVPDSNVAYIHRWLRFFEPNHQSMFIRKDISQLAYFDTSSPISADATWKRTLLSSFRFAYIEMPFVIFKLGGVSSSYSLDIVSVKLNEHSRSAFQKFLEILKFVLFKLGVMSPRLQKLKSQFFGFIF